MNENLINIISKFLKQEFVVSMPTDTIIGLLCIASSSQAIKKIYELKRRNVNKPLSILISNINMAEKYIKLSSIGKKILNDKNHSFTLIAQKSIEQNNLSKDINLANNNLALRIPKNDLLLDIINNINMPLIATSANQSGNEHLTNIKEVEKLFAQQVKCFDLESISSSIPSAIIDVSKAHKIEIIRATKQQKLYINEKF